MTFKGMATEPKSLLALNLAFWVPLIPASVMMEMWSWMAISLIQFYLSWTTSRPISLKGSVLFLVNVKLKSKLSPPLLYLIPPNIHEAGILVPSNLYTGAFSFLPVVSLKIHLSLVSYTDNTFLLISSNGSKLTGRL
jgi:hypothetical protein